jgi:hypothetical protein
MYGSLYRIRNSIKFIERSRQATQRLIQRLKCKRKKRKREARKVRGYLIVQRCKSKSNAQVAKVMYMRLSFMLCTLSS